MKRICVVGLGLDALVIVCPGNMHVIVGWAWTLLLSYALGTPALLWFGHGCSGYRLLSEHERYHGLGMGALCMLSEHERYYGLGMGALCIVCSECSRDTNIITVWAWMRHSMLSEHERYYGLGMGALFIVCSVIVCSRNTISIMVWTWMRDSMLSEHERYYGEGMDALVIACSQNTNVIAAWAWMLWHSRSLFFEERDAWYTQYFGPPKHFECAVRATQVTAFFACLRSSGASNKNNSQVKNKNSSPSSSSSSSSSTSSSSSSSNGSSSNGSSSNGSSSSSSSN